MKNFTSKMKALLCMALCLMATVAYAQESITLGGASIPVVSTQTVKVTDMAGTAYSGLTAAFDTTKVNTALGVDSIAVAKEYIVNVTTNEAVENTSDGWRNGAGDLCLWGAVTEESLGYCYKINDPGSGEIDYLGAHETGTWTVDDTFKGIFAFVANNKAALVVVEVSFIAPPSNNHADYLSDVEVVETFNGMSERESMQGSVADTIAFQVGDLKTKLGITDDKLLTSDWFYLIPCADMYDANTEVATGVIAPLDSLDGWVHQVLDGDGVATAECCASSVQTGNAFRVYDFTYDAEQGIVQFLVAQKPGTNLTTSQLYTNIYLMNGNKAIKIVYTMDINMSEIKGLSDMTNCGTIEVTKTDTPESSGYPTIAASFDLATVAEYLGCTTEDITFKELQAENTFYEGDPTEGSGGWYLSGLTGYVSTWGAANKDTKEGAWFITDVSTGSFNIGIYAGAVPTSVGDVYTTHVYATYADKYVDIVITLKTEADKTDWANWVCAGSRSVIINQHASVGEYVWSTKNTSTCYVTLKDEDCQNLIGCSYSEAVFMAKSDSATQAANNGNPFTAKYTCDPNPGFWCDANGVNVGWGGSSVWGLTIANTTLADGYALECMYMGSAEVGTTYKGTFYLVNKSEGKYIKYKVTYNLIADEEDETASSGGDVVGQIDVKAIADDNSEEAQTGTEFDLDEIAKALGYEDATDMAEYNCMASDDSPSYVQPATGLTFDATGAYNSAGDYSIFFEDGYLYTVVNNGVEVAEDFSLPITVYFYGIDANENITSTCYAVNVTLMSRTAYETPVKGIKAATKSATMYDLTGRRVVKAQKGVYIQDGKKYINK